MQKTTTVWTCDWCGKSEKCEKYPRLWLKWNRTVAVEENADGGGLISYLRLVHLCSLECATAFIDVAGAEGRLNQSDRFVSHPSGKYMMNKGATIFLDGAPIRQESTNPNQGGGG